MTTKVHKHGSFKDAHTAYMFGMLACVAVMAVVGIQSACSSLQRTYIWLALLSELQNDS